MRVQKHIHDGCASGIHVRASTACPRAKPRWSRRAFALPIRGERQRRVHPESVEDVEEAMPQPKYRDMTWEQLEGSTRRALRWLNACTLLRKHDLLAVAFPPGHDRRRVDHALTIWE